MGSRAQKIRMLLAYAAIYFVWGGTFLAVRTAVAVIPPFLCAAMRFLPASVLLLGWHFARGGGWPALRQVRGAMIVAVLIFVGDYGFLYMGQQRVPSGPSAVVVATIPLFTTLAEILFLGTEKMTLRLGASLLVGLLGVGVLVNPMDHLGGQPIDSLGTVFLLIAALSWSLAAALTQKVDLPEQKPLSAGVQMLAGGCYLLLLGAAKGELKGFHGAAMTPAVWGALAYLTLAGSILAFTCYLWLLDHDSPSRVSTYAYVNPVVAVLLGWWVGGEGLGLRPVVGIACVLVSVVAITTAKRRTRPTAADYEVRAAE